jgi:hypothetical protein
MVRQTSGAWCGLSASGSFTSFRSGGFLVRIKTVMVTYGRKFNLALVGHGDFESAHIEVTLWADVEDDDDVNKGLETLRQTARDHVRSEFFRLLPKQEEPAALEAEEPAIAEPIKTEHPPQSENRRRVNRPNKTP